MKFETLSVHTGREVDPTTGAVTPPMHLSTTFERDADGEYPRGFSYARAENPNRRALEECIAALEGGSEALAFASGSAASMAIFSLLRPGDHVIAPQEAYHGTAKQVRDILAPLGISHDFIDMSSLEALSQALDASTGAPRRMVWVETPANPMLSISDIQATATLAHEHDALVVCDNTFATPVWQRPFEHDADLVMHSSTKYFGGHSDVMGGAVICREPGALATQLRDYQMTAGNTPSPFDCWLLRRSLTTLSCRVRAQTANAALIAEYLQEHTGVEEVFYPGLSAHPGHDIARRQMRGGYGAMVSFCVYGGRQEAFEVASRLRLFTRATSLGGVESLIEHRASIEGPHTLTPENLLRLSVGLEAATDLIEDLERALA